MRRFLLFTLAFLIYACSAPPKLSPLPADAVILAFGDSITYGIGAGQGESYPERLAELTGRRILSSGIPGEVTKDGLKRLPGVLEGVAPSLLILCHGGNDLIRKTGDEAAADNIRAMIKEAKDRGIDVVLVGVPKPGIPLSVPAFYKKAAEETGIPYEGDVLEDILSNGSLKADYIHPNADGYRQMAGKIAELLKKSGALD